MTRLILVGFGFLALVFYEMSGGADFDPVAAREAAVIARVEIKGSSQFDVEQPARAKLAVSADDGPTVTRMSLNLTSFNEVLDDTSQPKPAILAKPVADIDLTSPQTIPSALSTTATFDSIPDAEGVLSSIIFAGSTSQASSQAVTTQPDTRFVSATVVNMRGGPGTGFDVVAKLNRDTEVEILQDNGTGWVKLRAVAGGPEGWIADFLLSNG